MSKKGEEAPRISSRAQRKLEQEQRPEQAAKLGKRNDTQDGFCPTCKTWYNTNKGGHNH